MPKTAEHVTPWITRASAGGGRACSRATAAWALVGLCAAVTFVGLATAGRPPGIDLPQHALFLHRMLAPCLPP